ncbi:MAG: alpha-amylase, partial [Aliifodinibius sp.]|nr:alpha-amylase [Fodinibius sp.]
MSLFVLLFLVLYCERKHGEGKPLADYSEHRLPEPPSWAKQGVLYELYLRAFTEEGTFRAAIEKLDHLKKLGVDIIWLMPIYPIGEEGRKGRLGSPYAVKNFRSINPELGNEEDFRLLIDEIHKRQMKVLLDIVPNHAANDHPLIDAHPEWFMQDEDGNFIRVEEDWTDVIDFTYQNPQMRRYMKENLFYWVREFDIDGYRCDVAGMVPHDFWADVIPALREIKPDLFLLAEWEDP